MLCGVPPTVAPTDDVATAALQMSQPDDHMELTWSLDDECQVNVPGIEGGWYDGVVRDVDMEEEIVSIKYKYPAYTALCTAYIQFEELSERVRHRSPVVDEVTAAAVAATTVIADASPDTDRRRSSRSRRLRVIPSM